MHGTLVKLSGLLLFSTNVETLSFNYAPNKHKRAQAFLLEPVNNPPFDGPKNLSCESLTCANSEVCEKK
jgi:hypothetical protein